MDDRRRRKKGHLQEGEKSNNGAHRFRTRKLIAPSFGPVCLHWDFSAPFSGYRLFCSICPWPLYRLPAAPSARPPAVVSPCLSFVSLSLMLMIEFYFARAIIQTNCRCCIARQKQTDWQLSWLPLTGSLIMRRICFLVACEIVNWLQ